MLSEVEHSRLVLRIQLVKYFKSLSSGSLLLAFSLLYLFLPDRSLYHVFKRGFHLGTFNDPNRKQLVAAHSLELRTKGILE